MQKTWKVQGKYGAEFEKYWVDEKESTITTVTRVTLDGRGDEGAHVAEGDLRKAFSSPQKVVPISP